MNSEYDIALIEKHQKMAEERISFMQEVLTSLKTYADYSTEKNGNRSTVSTVPYKSGLLKAHCRIGNEHFTLQDMCCLNVTGAFNPHIFIKCTIDFGKYNGTVFQNVCTEKFIDLYCTLPSTEVPAEIMAYFREYILNQYYHNETYVSQRIHRVHDELYEKIHHFVMTKIIENVQYRTVSIERTKMIDDIIEDYSPAFKCTAIDDEFIDCNDVITSTAQELWFNASLCDASMYDVLKSISGTGLFPSSAVYSVGLTHNLNICYYTTR